jgi:hypothetical protein
MRIRQRITALQPGMITPMLSDDRPCRLAVTTQPLRQHGIADLRTCSQLPLKSQQTLV